MARKPNHFTRDLELDKFDTNDAGETVVRTTATGEFTPTGLKNGLKITGVMIGTTETEIPGTAGPLRNNISVHNKSETQILYIGPTGVTADDNLATGGWEVFPRSYFQIDITADVIFYGIYPTSSELIKVLEIS